jgi:hypothetical protein
MPPGLVSFFFSTCKQQEEIKTENNKFIKQKETQHPDEMEIEK